jgi:hypothetical protein
MGCEIGEWRRFGGDGGGMCFDLLGTYWDGWGEELKVVWSFVVECGIDWGFYTKFKAILQQCEAMLQPWDTFEAMLHIWEVYEAMLQLWDTLEAMLQIQNNSKVFKPARETCEHFKFSSSLLQISSTMTMQTFTPLFSLAPNFLHKIITPD